MILQRPSIFSPSVMDIFNSTASSSPSPASQNDVQDDTSLLYQILQEVQMLKEIITALIKRRTMCNRATQTECQPAVASQVSNDTSPKPLNLSASKRSCRTLSDSTTMRQSKLSRVSNAAGASSSIEEAVAKIKAIRSEKSNAKAGSSIKTESDNICKTPSDSAEHNSQVIFLPGQFRCSSQQQNNAMVDMIASAAAAAATVTGCYQPMINGDGAMVAAGMIPAFSPLIDSLMLSSHCAYGDVSQNAMVDFVQQNSNQYAVTAFQNRDYKTCQRGAAAAAAAAEAASVECKLPADTVTAVPQTPKAKQNPGDSKGQKSFGADYYKPYACQHANCNKRFANKFLLKKHEFIHTGERPHQCPYCCKRFNRKDNLLRHKKTHESNNVLVKRTVRPLGFCQTTEVSSKQTTGFAGESVSQFTVESTGTASSLLSPEGSSDQDAIICERTEEEENGSEELAELNQESTSERNECGAVVHLKTPSNNLLLSAVTPKTTSTSQLPVGTSFGVTN